MSANIQSPYPELLLPEGLNVCEEVGANGEPDAVEHTPLAGSHQRAPTRGPARRVVLTVIEWLNAT